MELRNICDGVFISVLWQSKVLRCRDVEVDEARVITWWHLAAQLLLRSTGGEKITIFREVSLMTMLNMLE